MRKEITSVSAKVLKVSNSQSKIQKPEDQPTPSSSGRDRETRHERRTLKNVDEVLGRIQARRS
jgi:hypothetical protein